MIDLHTHTVESDGTLTPEELLQAARRAGLVAVGITDHDTFAGYDQAAVASSRDAVEVVCGIEISTKFRRQGGTHLKSVHLLGYFPEMPPGTELRLWLRDLQESRRERNGRMAARLRELGIQITLEEVEKLGRSMAGRPHFARLLLEKGYVSTLQEAFDVYLAEGASAYVDRHEAAFPDAMRRLAASGGVSSLAHPGRLCRRNPAALARILPEMCDMGLRAVEAYHPDHSPEEVEEYISLARHFGLLVTGGSDFHGENKPGVELGLAGDGLRVPASLLDMLRRG